MRQPSKDTTALEEARLRQRALGEGLRRLFDDVVNEPVPASFMDILRRGDAESGRPD